MGKPRAPVPTESEEQQAVIEWASWQPWIRGRLIAVPNGSHLAGDARQRAIQMARLKREGLREGVSDLFLAIPAGRYAGLWLEMKRADPGLSKVSDAQTDWLALMEESGYSVAVCHGAAVAIRAIQDYKQHLEGRI